MQQTGYILLNKKNNKKNDTQNLIQKKRNYPPKEYHYEDDENKDEVKSDSQNEAEQKIESLTKSTEEFEYRLKAYWLFELIPNEVIIDLHKVSFIDKTLMFKNVTSIFIKDIAKVEVSNDFLFATLEIINVTQTIELSIKHLKKDEARNAIAIIQGLMVGYKNDINLAELDPKTMIDELMKLGSPVV